MALVLALIVVRGLAPTQTTLSASFVLLVSSVMAWDPALHVQMACTQTALGRHNVLAVDVALRRTVRVRDVQSVWLEPFRMENLRVIPALRSGWLPSMALVVASSADRELRPIPTALSVFYANPDRSLTMMASVKGAHWAKSPPNLEQPLVTPAVVDTRLTPIALNVKCANLESLLLQTISATHALAA